MTAIKKAKFRDEVKGMGPGDRYRLIDSLEAVKRTNWVTEQLIIIRREIREDADRLRIETDRIVRLCGF